MYYLCSKIKGDDQLHCFRTADLHLCWFFLHMQIAGFLLIGLIFNQVVGCVLCTIFNLQNVL